MIDPAEVRQRVRDHISNIHQTHTVAAHRLGMCQSQLSEILHGKRPVPDWLLARVGLRKQRQWLYYER